jgi:transcriptional regulator with XRE-family HTH domain
MVNLRRLAVRIRSLRRALGLSARELSLKAGLNQNYVSNLELRKWNPKPAAVSAIARALGATDAETAELRRAAGIDPDFSANPEAKKDRRAAWPFLAYVIANDVLLPRQALDAELAREDTCATVLRHACGSVSVAQFMAAMDGEREPTRLRSMLDRTLHPPSIAPLLSRLRNVLNETPGNSLREEVLRPGPESPRPTAYTSERLHILYPLCRPKRTLHEVFDYVENFDMDYNFAVAAFPPLYWSACRVWPFEKVGLPLAARPLEAQRLLYDEIRNGCSLVELDAALLGEGRLGGLLSATPARRPMWNAPDGRYFLQLESPGDEEPSWYDGPAPDHDRVFDHFDRTAFLEWFPLLKIDEQGTVAWVNSINLPSGHRWADRVRSVCPAAPTAAAPIACRATHVNSELPISTMSIYPLSTRRIAWSIANLAANAVDEGWWLRLCSAFDVMDGPHEPGRALAAAFSSSPPASGDIAGPRATEL